MKVFIYADRRARECRAVEQYGRVEENVSQVVRQIDKQRRLHYEAYTTQNWGDRGNYHLMLDSEAFGIDGCVSVICEAALCLGKKPSLEDGGKSC